MEHSVKTRRIRTLLQPLHRFERQLVQTLAAVRDIGNDLIAHAALPKFLEVIQDACYRLVVRIARKEQSDLVGPVNHAV
jgi:hypothetical protein